MKRMKMISLILPEMIISPPQKPKFRFLSKHTAKSVRKTVPLWLSLCLITRLLNQLILTMPDSQAPSVSQVISPVLDVRAVTNQADNQLSANGVSSMMVCFASFCGRCQQHFFKCRCRMFVVAGCWLQFLTVCLSVTF